MLFDHRVSAHGVLTLLALAATGCTLAAPPFAGTVARLSLQGSTALPPGQHLELWARDAFADIVRVRSIYDAPDPAHPGQSIHLEPRGLTLRPAITLDDPCMIDGSGHLLVTPDAYPAAVTVAGIPQTPDEQAAQVRARVQQLVSSSNCDGSGLNPVSHCGRETSTLLAVLPYELVGSDGTGQVSAAPPALPFDAPPDQRLAACQHYWASSPLAYTPNPAQLTAPAHGALYGVVAYQTTTPTAAYDYVNFDSPEHLAGLGELWLTVEPDQVDPLHRGPIYLRGTPDPGGNGWVHLDLQPPLGSGLLIAGSAALLVDGEQNPETF